MSANTLPHPYARLDLDLLPEAQQQDHVLAAHHLLGDPEVIGLIDQCDDVLVPHPPVAQVVLDAVVHVVDVGAGLVDVGLEVERQISRQRRGVLWVVIVPRAVGPDEGVAIADGQRSADRADRLLLELAIEPPERVGGGEGRGEAWPHLHLVEVGLAGGRVVLPRTGFPVEGTPIGGRDEVAPGAGIRPEGPGGPVVIPIWRPGVDKTDTEHLERARREA